MVPWCVFFTNSRIFKCSLNSAKRGFYRAANSICGKVGPGGIASEEVASAGLVTAKRYLVNVTSYVKKKK